MILFFTQLLIQKKLNPSTTQWYYVNIIQKNSLQAFSNYIPKKKKKWEIKAKKKKNATKLLSLFHIKHPAAAHATKGGQLIAVPKPKANNGIHA